MASQSRGIRRSASVSLRIATKRLVFVAGRALGRTPVVCYATWRTSSTAVYHAVRRAGAWPCVKAHALHPDHRFVEYSETFRSPANAVRPHVGDIVARRSVIEPGRDARWVILVRDPLAMAASLMVMDPDLRAAAFAGGPTSSAPDPDVVRQRAPLDLLDRWFELDVRPSLGWSPLDEQFDRERGWTVGQSPRGPVLTMRADVPDEAKSRALSEFLGREVRVGRENSSSSHRSGDALRAVQALLATDPTTLRAAEGLRTSTWFWRPGTLEAARASWARTG